MHLPVSHRPAAGHKGAARATSPLHEAVTPLHQAARAAHPPQAAGRDGTASRASAPSRHGRGTVATITGQRGALAGPARDEGGPGPGTGATRSRITGSDVTPIRAGETSVYLYLTFTE
jgi:hypothetical protein